MESTSLPPLGMSHAGGVPSQLRRTNTSLISANGLICPAVATPLAGSKDCAVSISSWDISMMRPHHHADPQKAQNLQLQCVRLSMQPVTLLRTFITASMSPTE
jgi:hypothetical protein